MTFQRRSYLPIARDVLTVLLSLRRLPPDHFWAVVVCGLAYTTAIVYYSVAQRLGIIVCAVLASVTMAAAVCLLLESLRSASRGVSTVLLGC